MRIRTFFILSDSDLACLNTSVEKIHAQILNNQNENTAKIHFNKDGELVDIEPAGKLNPGEGFIVDDCLQICSVIVLHDGKIIIRTLERNPTGHGFQFNHRSSVDSFAVKQDNYPLNEELYRKLSGYHGIGGGHVTINIKTQEVEDIAVRSRGTIDPAFCGVVKDRDENTITVTCSFANGCANVVYLVK